MKKIVNGIIVEMSDREQILNEQNDVYINDTDTLIQLADGEAVKYFVRTIINDIDLPVEIAVRMVDYYPDFHSVIGRHVKSGYRFQYGNRLFQVIAPEITLENPPSDNTGEIYVCAWQLQDNTENDLSGHI